VKNRKIIQQQIDDLMIKATHRPMPQDDMGMVGFMSALLAAHMQALLFQAEEKQEENNLNLREAGEEKV
jgi:hypothetical protein